MSAHTPEPWSINEWPQGDAEIRIGAVGYPRIAAVLLKYESINGQKANAERIVACVNSCAGIEDPAKAIPDMLAYLEQAAAGFATIRNNSTDEVIRLFALNSFDACREIINKVKT